MRNSQISLRKINLLLLLYFSLSIMASGPIKVVASSLSQANKNPTIITQQVSDGGGNLKDMQHKESKTRE